MASNPLTPFVTDDGVLLLDGGLATALEDAGHRLDRMLWSASLLRDRPDAIRATHRAYLAAGADCITTASYQASFEGFRRAGLDDDDSVALLLRSSALALEARDEWVAAAGSAVDADGPDRPARPKTPLVAASIGPYGAHLADGSEYHGRYGASVGELERFHHRRLGLLAESGVDLLACETIPSQSEVGVLLDVLDRQRDDVFAWLSFSCRDERRLSDGSPIEEAVTMCSARRRVAAIGVNCTAPAYVPELIARAAEVTDRPLVAYPNSGEHWDATNKRWGEPSGPGREAVGDRRMSDESWMSGVLGALGAGARIVGGCCRTGPADIAELRRRIDLRDWGAEGLGGARRPPFA
ncbi:MAG: homocysteine S-methyltransferase [Gemmatimonadota bacterium]|nr:homocysteine S-methyltransferase [Gemmatimonadota bacterium]